MYTDIVLRLKKDSHFITSLRSRIMRSLVFGRGNDMKISRVWAVYFSPTGNVKEVTNPIAKNCQGTVSAARAVDFTLPDNRKSAKAFEKDLVVFGTPVYAERVPNKILPWVQRGIYRRSYTCGTGGCFWKPQF